MTNLSDLNHTLSLGKYQKRSTCLVKEIHKLNIYTRIHKFQEKKTQLFNMKQNYHSNIESKLKQITNNHGIILTNTVENKLTSPQSHDLSGRQGQIRDDAAETVVQEK